MDQEAAEPAAGLFGCVCSVMQGWGVYAGVSGGSDDIKYLCLHNLHAPDHAIYISDDLGHADG